MKTIEFTMKPRKPQERVIEAAKKENQPVPIARKEFKLSIPQFEPSDIIDAVSNNDQLALSYIARLLSEQVKDNLKDQLANDEIFPVDQEVDVENFDKEVWTLNGLATQPVSVKISDIEFTDEEVKDFCKAFVDFMKPRYSNNPRAETLLSNIADIVSSGFKAIAKDADKIEKTMKYTLEFFQNVDGETLEKYGTMYEYAQGMYERRLKSIEKAKTKTDIDLE